MFRFFNVAIIAFVLMLNINIAVAHDCPSNTYAEPVSTLDPDIQPTDYTSSPIDGGNGTWDVTAPYGHVTGIATCNTTSGTWATAYSQYNFEQGTEGQHCWCKMLSPARSAWVYGSDGGYGSASECAANCAGYCGYAVRYYADYREAVFGSAYQCVANPANDCPVGTHQDNTPLDPDIEPTTDTYSQIDGGNGTWDVTAPYGHVTGIATCNSTSGSWGTATSAEFEQGTTGQYCWCKMLSPARSAWVYDHASSSASECAADCASGCTSGFRYHPNFRRGVFGSVTGDICMANTININWQNATGTTQESNTCTYGVTLSTPATAPTKRGYTFVGWSYQ